MGVLDSIKCALIEVLNMFIEHVLNNVLRLIAWLIGLLPSLPLPNVELVWGEFGSAVGYFIPVGTLVSHFSMMLVLVIVWYGYEYIMRWIKMIK